MMRELKISQSITSRNTDSLNKYLVDINRYPLLTPEEETDLAEQVKLGGRQGREARDTLVKSNLRFVVSVAKQYQHRGLVRHWQRPSLRPWPPSSEPPRRHWPPTPSTDWPR